MGMGQMLTVIGAITLLSIIALTINNLFIQKTITMLESEAALNAISIAQSMIDEIKQKNRNYKCSPASEGERCSGFDERTRTTPIYNPVLFTPSTNFGPDPGEVAPEIDMTVPFVSFTVFDDVDDYHRYRRKVQTTFMGEFDVVDSIFYGREDNPNTVSPVQTYFKKIVVTVRHRNIVTYPYIQLSDVVVYRRDF